MLRDLLLWAVAVFVVQPYQAELEEKLAAVRAPRAVMEAVADCASTAIPALADRAASDPWWAAVTGLKVWTGFIPPEAVLRDAAPACGPAMEAVRPYLTGRTAQARLTGAG